MSPDAVHSGNGTSDIGKAGNPLLSVQSLKGTGRQDLPEESGIQNRKKPEDHSS
jgi:hypothetical protein